MEAATARRSQSGADRLELQPTEHRATKAHAASMQTSLARARRFDMENPSSIKVELVGSKTP
jgi:hypothetical protein